MLGRFECCPECGADVDEELLEGMVPMTRCRHCGFEETEIDAPDSRGVLHAQG